jgi:hypothetical protein
LKVQPERAATAFAAAAQARQGFLARILTCAPESLIGKRLHQEPPPEAWEASRRYQDRMLGILWTPYPLVPGTRNELAPRAVSFSVDAATRFKQFAKEVAEHRPRAGITNQSCYSPNCFQSTRPVWEQRSRLIRTSTSPNWAAKIFSEGFRSPASTRVKRDGWLRACGRSRFRKSMQQPPPHPEGGGFRHGEWLMKSEMPTLADALVATALDKLSTLAIKQRGPAFAEQRDMLLKIAQAAQIYPR